MSIRNLRTIAYQCLLDLSTEEGINASGKDEIYGCIFGRDTAITVLKMLKVCLQDHRKDVSTKQLLDICRRALITLTRLQGKEINIESGEEPGKFIHEYRTDKYQHLLELETPWYVYPDGVLRNYDSIDSTPLALIAMYNYWEITKDYEFLVQVLPAVEKGLSWLLTFADRDQDGLVEYEFIPTRKYGGLRVQSWTDSHESLLRPDGTMPKYPIAPVEVQGYVWLALRLWTNYYDNKALESRNSAFAHTLAVEAKAIKKKCNELFMFKDGGYWYAAQALDGDNNQIQTITGNPLLLLWASYSNKGKIESILENQYIHDMVKRAFLPDMFDTDAGIRTMSASSPTYNPREDSYHNGSFWPKLNGMVHEGLVNWGFVEEAHMLREASLKPIVYFGSPIELYMKGENGTYIEFRSPTGQVSCKNQAWSAAVTLDLVSE
jgi:glycogen debranching enzyme